MPVRHQMSLSFAVRVQDAPALQETVDTVSQLVQPNQGLLARQLLVRLLRLVIHRLPL